MNKILSIAILLLTVFGGQAVLADQAADKQSKNTAPNVQEFDKQMAQIQENMQKMQEQMDEINKTQDPKAREKLFTEHWATMQSNMQLMSNMWGPDGCMGGWRMGSGMMGNHMMGNHMMGWNQMGSYYDKLTPEQQKQWQYMMDRYMPMQQMMMNHMMWQNQGMWQQPPSE